jgi:DNA polymerase-3 subunit delta'
MRLQSQVIITSRFDEVIQQLRALAHNNERFVPIVREGNFVVDDAQEAIEKAYLASYERTIIILAAEHFSPVVQNKLLKIIEEPPPRTDFILMLPTKTTLLPTIRSRLPIVLADETRPERDSIDLDMERLDLKAMYAFVQEHKRTDAATAKVLLEQIATEAIRSGRYDLDTRTLDLFRDSRLALDRGSPPPFVLTGVLLKLLARKHKSARAHSRSTHSA